MAPGVPCCDKLIIPKEFELLPQPSRLSLSEPSGEPPTPRFLVDDDATLLEDGDDGSNRETELLPPPRTPPEEDFRPGGLPSPDSAALLFEAPSPPSIIMVRLQSSAVAALDRAARWENDETPPEAAATSP